MKTVTITDFKRLEEIIDRCRICFVGITDLDGFPYVLPMTFGYKNNILYLHSGPEGSKLEMLEKNNQVCITFCVGDDLIYQHAKVACSYSMRSESVMCRGKVEFVEDMNHKRECLDIIMHHYTDNDFGYSDPAVANVKVWKIAITEMTGKIFGLRGYEKP